MILPIHLQKALLDKYSSRQNKLWMIADFISRGFIFEWMWAGDILKSRMLFKFETNKDFQAAKSYDEDIFPKLKWAKDKRVKNEKS